MSDHAESGASGAAPAPGSSRPLIGLLAVVLLHGALVAAFVRPSVVLDQAPISDIDYPLHYHQVDRAVQAFKGWGKLWGYDPLVLAGHPAGAMEDISSKSLELFVIALEALGVHQATAFNLYILLVHLLVPFVGFFAARLFRLSRWQAVGVAGLWVLLWFFDSMLHWLWFCGMISWAAVTQLVVLEIALVYRTLDDVRRGGAPAREGPGALREALRWLGLAALTALLALMHPFAALALAAPVIGLYLRDARRLPLRGHAALVISAGGAVAMAMIWLLPALAMRHYLLDEETFLRPTLDYLLYDFLDLMKDDMQTGPPVRTMIRMLCLVSAGVCLWRWRKAGDRRFLPLALLLLVGLLFSYLGGHLGVLRRSQPYRQMGPVVLGAAIPAVVLLGELLHPRTLRAASRPIKLLLVLALVLIVPRFVRGVLFYFPQVIPREMRTTDPTQRRPSMLAGFVAPPVLQLRHHGPPKVIAAVRRWLNQHHRPHQGRVLVQEYMLAESLAATTRQPLLGGLEQRAIWHADAHLFRKHNDGDLPGEALRDYLERYAVRYVVVSQIRRKLEWRKDLLEFRQLLGPIRIYETKIKPSYFARGQGQVVAQGFNKLRVKVPAGQPEVVLRFHWMEGLRCKPGCSVDRVKVQDDRVGFIRVRNPPRRFVIFQSYQL
jgi:hypothetical protein